MTTALAIMRLQPLHNGHKFIIDTMLAEHQKAVVMIGSAGARDAKNPFPTYVRRQMLQRLYLAEMAQGRLVVQPIKDIHNAPRWVDYVLQTLGGIVPDVYYCGDTENGCLFADKGFPVRNLERTADGVAGTALRDKLAQGDAAWQQDVPAPIIPIIKRYYKINPITKGVTHAK